ncbi:hypothetical protein BASA50_000524 [Batrachochytrium salamandrivorans]|uniref:Bromo domain-containing protein n=1 Tax=Batrachochytrium salamandrivorans TaxID=1357716 RepID=A0ABQ8EU18_9FUNG|nr:hypothetical protein BASA62_002633 [Batrachochytrium salamandrivorans]KAH6578612.1 hypothetical protein BASA61_000076 [Batrachochytrium salamandrivorans]KAH6586570.1 hypothetical protein BASA50_000524 [Batrachochytrium salamandrivorans]
MNENRLSNPPSVKVDDYFPIAQQLLRNSRWRLYLTQEEGAVFELAASDHLLWTSMMHNPLSCFDRPEFKVLGYFCEDEDSDEGHMGARSSSQQTVIAFRIRSMLFEQLLPNMYGASVTTAIVTEPSSSSRKLIEKEDAVMKDAFTEEDGAVVPMSGPAIASSTDSTLLPNSLPQSKSYGDSLEHVKIDVDKTLTCNYDVSDLIPIDDMYYSLEYDAELLASSAVQDQADEPETVMKLEGNSSLATQLEGGESSEIHASLKHLFQTIHHNADPQQLRDLRKLLTEVRPSKSKWANDDRQGQEQLYEALDNVLSELKNYTEHSLPFLKPVQKREAPNYFDIIARPMDLGTDSIYRRHATAMKRRSTDLLKKVPEITIKNSGDSDSEEDVDNKADGKNTLNPTMTPIDSLAAASTTSSSTPWAGSSLSSNDINRNSDDPKTQRQNQHMQGDEMQIDTNEQTRFMSTPTGERQGQQEDVSDDRWMQTRRWKQATLSYRRDYLHQRDEQSKLSFADRLACVRRPEEMQSFMCALDAYLNRNHLRKRFFSSSDPDLKLLEQIRLGGSSDGSEASIPSVQQLYASATGASSRMGAFGALPLHSTTKEQHTALESSDDKSNAVTDERNLRASEAFRLSFLPELQYCTSSLSQIHPQPSSLPGDLDPFFAPPEDRAAPKIPRAPMPTMSEYPEFVPDPKSLLHASMTKNVLELQHLKDTFYKILAKQAPLQPFELSLPNPVPRDPYKPLWCADDLPPPAINRISAQSILRKMCSVVIAHAGFDGVCESALASITEIAVHFFSNIGRTLRVYLDKYSHFLSPEIILIHTLSSNGIEDQQALETYIHNDVLRLGVKLTDIRRKLDAAYSQLDRSPDHVVADDDVIFEESQDQIISGNLFQDMGVDLLGLKDFGIDITSIPTELWNRKAEKPLRVRLKRTFLDGSAAAATATSLNQLPEDTLLKLHEVWPPIDPSKHIGLLRSFYSRKGMTVEDLVANENRHKNKDEKLMLKYAIQGRKRLPSGYLQAEESKKRKRKNDGKTPGASTTPSTTTPGATAISGSQPPSSTPGVAAVASLSPGHTPAAITTHVAATASVSKNLSTPNSAGQSTNPASVSSADSQRPQMIKTESKPRKDERRSILRKVGS